ncbi:hypothetical protein JAAARDRAFT_200449 [Jaapia argillacea MUCL 33604]|uniref:Uncharacterized protein n=1 Tax=Jaapia argillacea MUCL 33604 TaxID=933084 RepID=A0A067P511_9AGAM|nr:hypothetical protein JAAARDRAFT_200449 [Jaapia argillacea MUCL 33604]
MARTKQTPRKSTGGSAPKKSILGSAAKLPAVRPGTRQSKSTSPLPPPKVQETYCALCSNGGQLFDYELEKLSFLCPACHQRDSTKRPGPYVGLYCDDDQPFLKEGLKVSAKKVTTLGSRVSNEPLAVIILALHGLSIRGSPYDVALTQLRNYYGANDTLVAHEIVFDLVGGNAVVSAHIKKMRAVVKNLKKQSIRKAIVLILTHANDENGLPFFETNGHCSFKEFFDFVIGDDLISLAKSWDTTWFLLTCGPMMTAGTSRTDLISEAQQRGIERIIGVGIAGFFPCMLNSFMIAFIDHIIIGGEAFDKAIHKLIVGSTATLSHIPIYVISARSDDKPLSAIRYYWFHPKLNPHGQPMPIQCDHCGHIRDWKSKGVVSFEKDFVVRCRSCGTLVTIERPHGSLGKLDMEGEWIMEGLV